MRRRKNNIKLFITKKLIKSLFVSDGRTYSRKCCDGTLEAQGIGSIHKTSNYLLQENRDLILSENNDKIILE